MVNSRRKGCRYEDKIAKKFSKWTGFEFQRTPLSGGWNKVTHPGDIHPKNNEFFPFAVECKKHKDFDLMSLFNPEKSKLWKWVKQSIDQVRAYNDHVLKAYNAYNGNFLGKEALEYFNKHYKHPLLVFSKNRSPDYIAWSSAPAVLLSSKARMMYIEVFDNREYLQDHCAKMDIIRDHDHYVNLGILQDQDHYVKLDILLLDEFLESLPYSPDMIWKYKPENPHESQ